MGGADCPTDRPFRTGNSSSSAGKPGTPHTHRTHTHSTLFMALNPAGARVGAIDEQPRQRPTLNRRLLLLTQLPPPLLLPLLLPGSYPASTSDPSTGPSSIIPHGQQPKPLWSPSSKREIEAREKARHRVERELRRSRSSGSSQQPSKPRECRGSSGNVKPACCPQLQRSGLRTPQRGCGQAPRGGYNGSKRR